MVSQLHLQLNNSAKYVQVPKTLHGSVYNDGWFGSGAAWSPDEDRLAYVAEVSVLHTVNAMLWCHLLISATCTFVIANDETPGAASDDRMMLQAPAATQTPSWGNTKPDIANQDDGAGSGGKDKAAGGEGAAPRTWRGVGSFQASRE